MFLGSVDSMLARILSLLLSEAEADADDCILISVRELITDASLLRRLFISLARLS